MDDNFFAKLAQTFEGWLQRVLFFAKLCSMDTRSFLKVIAFAYASLQARSPRAMHGSSSSLKAITVIVPFGSGGAVDTTARLILPRLAQALGNPLVIENVPGAAGSIGAQRVARAAPDGHTLLFTAASPLQVVPLVNPAAAKYDPVNDFVPLASLVIAPFVLIGRTNLAARNMAELLRLAASQSKALALGTDGTGTSLHLTAELIRLYAGLNTLHVPYKSGPQVLTEVVSNQIDLAVLPLTLAQPFIRSGQVRAYGVTTKHRWPGLPDVPALAEMDELKNVEVEAWLGMFGPAGLSSQASSLLIGAIEQVAKDDELIRKLGDIANRPMVLTGTKFSEYLARERRKLKDVVEKTGIRTQ